MLLDQLKIHTETYIYTYTYTYNYIWLLIDLFLYNANFLLPIFWKEYQFLLETWKNVSNFYLFVYFLKNSFISLLQFNNRYNIHFPFLEILKQTIRQYGVINSICHKWMDFADSIYCFIKMCCMTILCKIL